MAYQNHLVLSEIIDNLKQENQTIKEQNKKLVQRIYQLQNELANQKVLSQRLKGCYNCSAEHCKDCSNLKYWKFVGDK